LFIILALLVFFDYCFRKTLMVNQHSLEYPRKSFCKKHNFESDEGLDEQQSIFQNS